MSIFSGYLGVDNLSFCGYALGYLRLNASDFISTVGIPTFFDKANPPIDFFV
jgi:hypothetical protein